MRWASVTKFELRQEGRTMAFFFLLIHGPVMVPIFKDLITLKGPEMTNTCPLSVPYIEKPCQKFLLDLSCDIFVSLEVNLFSLTHCGFCNLSYFLFHFAFLEAQGWGCSSKFITRDFFDEHTYVHSTYPLALGSWSIYISPNHYLQYFSTLLFCMYFLLLPLILCGIDWGYSFSMKKEI